MGRGRGHGRLLVGPAQTGCPPAARAGGLTSLGWAQEAALECPRRKTADRNIPLRALLWASALTRRGHYPSLTRGALIHLSEACIGPVLSVSVTILAQPSLARLCTLQSLDH